MKKSLKSIAKNKDLENLYKKIKELEKELEEKINENAFLYQRIKEYEQKVVFETQRAANLETQHFDCSKKIKQLEKENHKLRKQIQEEQINYGKLKIPFSKKKINEMRQFAKQLISLWDLKARKKKAFFLTIAKRFQVSYGVTMKYCRDIYETEQHKDITETCLHPDETMVEENDNMVHTKCSKCGAMFEYEKEEYNRINEGEDKESVRGHKAY